MGLTHSLDVTLPRVVSVKLLGMALVTITHKAAKREKQIHPNETTIAAMEARGWDCSDAKAALKKSAKDTPTKSEEG